ncbi:hypothetical protein SS37A_40410 (plasmid) [Methylocystis iwaonis]|uniref:Transposase n=1 Tax=Methylocystis iwaonis TaxID=2885079 RepID=A0ABM8EEN8_9HYPH|nr:hypothetical protein SS37A_40410 [Methylocystis iwaonis]
MAPRHDAIAGKLRERFGEGKALLPRWGDKPDGRGSPRKIAATAANRKVFKGLIVSDAFGRCDRADGMKLQDRPAKVAL